MKINVLFMEPAREFINSLPEKAKKKVAYNINRVSNGEMDNELFKKLGDTEIWEFRTLFNNIKYRLLAFWDTEQNSIVVATNGFIKKSQKTPQKEIERAKALRAEYFEDKD
ncbi:MAG: type II toxin-antitoxin system RelE/ParE family toxin [Muribaculaceae bacterium]|nr:type II toxin-antitoxin system RelE/ParE family toxin [Muribaculaceae bacterium]